MRLFTFLLAIVLIAACNDASSGTSAQTAPDGALYLRTYTWTGPYGTSLDISWLYFGNDGVLIRDPQNGVNPPDAEKENAGNTGTWKLEGDKMLIKWRDGKEESWSYEKEKGDFSIINGGIVTLQSGMPANYRLEGRYAASSALPNVSNTQTLTFKKDGTFTMNSTGAISMPETSAISSSDNAGTYTITGNTLTLKFNNGEEKKSVITIFDMGSKKSLVINTRHFPQESN